MTQPPGGATSLVDSHCHIDDARFTDDRDATIQRALDAGVTKMIAIGTGDALPDLESGIRLAEKYEPMYATVGIHPQFAKDAQEEHLNRLPELLRHPKVVAMGEIGIDYYWKPVALEEQHRLFLRQLEMAADARKPIVIHTRDAWEDTFTLLEQHWDSTGLPCILHCFTGGPNEAKLANERGYYVSFSGVVTYPKAIDVHEAARLIPIDRLLVETDSPYLAPIPYRGKRNEPSYVVYTAEKLAELRGQDFASVAAATTSNVHRVFGIT